MSFSKQAKMTGPARACRIIDKGIIRSKVLQDKGIVDKDIIRSKVLQDKGIVRNQNSANT